jgi:hypothetical protein
MGFVTEQTFPLDRRRMKNGRTGSLFGQTFVARSAHLLRSRLKKMSRHGAMGRMAGSTIPQASGDVNGQIPLRRNHVVVTETADFSARRRQEWLF